MGKVFDLEELNTISGDAAGTYYQDADRTADLSRYQSAVATLRMHDSSGCAVYVEGVAADANDYVVYLTGVSGTPGTQTAHLNKLAAKGSADRLEPIMRWKIVATGPFSATFRVAVTVK